MDIEPIQNYRYFQRVAQLRSIAGYADKGWSIRWDLNPQQSAWKAGTLPIELLMRMER